MQQIPRDTKQQSRNSKSIQRSHKSSIVSSQPSNNHNPNTITLSLSELFHSTRTDNTFNNLRWKRKQRGKKRRYANLKEFSETFTRYFCIMILEEYPCCFHHFSLSSGSKMRYSSGNELHLPQAVSCGLLLEELAEILLMFLGRAKKKKNR